MSSNEIRGTKAIRGNDVFIVSFPFPVFFSYIVSTYNQNNLRYVLDETRKINFQKKHFCLFLRNTIANFSFFYAELKFKI